MLLPASGDSTITLPSVVPLAAVAPAPAPAAALAPAPVAAVVSGAALEKLRQCCSPEHLFLPAGCGSAETTPMVACESEQAVPAVLGQILCAQGDPKVLPGGVAATSHEVSYVVLLALNR
eukprot:CAMPEP_0172776032 /NCGR_PEP_ID=MMETSP1074-20121228/199103_1 /TAXON_ID=2916 /ORGANISM="Ceratium fusus, Strain PA161109" /LENGTH=119 /DNA_ID=CAMNT_0013612735 /DNA_START=204 /DNA_END=560 /DNA_ORIENTATION=+